MMKSLAFLSLFDNSPQGRRAAALADALERYYDVTRYGYGEEAKPLIEFAGLESVLFYYVFDDPLFRKIMTYSRHRTGYIYVDDIDLMQAKYGWYPSLEAECESRSISPDEKRYLLRHDLTGYPPGTGFYGIEEDENGQTFRWTKQSFSLYIGSETDVVEIDTYTDFTTVLTYSNTISLLRMNKPTRLSLTTDQEVVDFTVFKPSIGYYMGDEERSLGIRIYDINYIKDGETMTTYSNTFSAEPPRRKLLDKKPLRPDRGFTISPHKSMIDTPAGELLRFTTDHVDRENTDDDVLFLTHRSTREEVEDLLDDLSTDVNAVFLRSDFCDVDSLVSKHNLELRVKVVNQYQKQPSCVIYPYNNDYGVLRLSKFTPVDVIGKYTAKPEFISTAYEDRINKDTLKRAETVSGIAVTPQEAATKIKELIA
jgi:hypothetical protein